MSSAGRDEVREWRKKWSHKPTPIPPDAGGLWYSEECVDQMLADYSAALTRENRELREALEWALPFALKAPDPTRSEDDVPSGEWLNKKKQARAALAKKEAVQLLQENASTDKKLH